MRLIVGAVRLPVIETLLVHEIIGIVSAIGLAIILAFRRLIRSDTFRRYKHDDGYCDSECP